MKTLLSLTFVFLVSSNMFGQIDIQGHRGARGLMPENSIPAFIRALEEGVTTLELDVVITKDKQVVVSHDTYMSPDFCSKPDGSPVEKNDKFNIYGMTYAEVHAFDCGSRGNARFPEQHELKTTKPLLKEMISQVEAYLTEHHLPKVGYNIEIKSSADGDNVDHPGVAEFSRLVLETIAMQLPKERFTIQSFDFRVLQYLHKAYPDVTLVALVENNKGVDANLKSLGFVPEVYSPYYVGLSKNDISLCHERGMKVVPWTVNTVKSMQNLIEAGVDGIITDYPNLAKELEY